MVKTLLEALGLVILVVYLFLQSWRATLIPLLAVPVSLIGTFVLFPLLGFSINTLSLFGLVLAIGLVVDDAIVVVEAVERHIQEGIAPKEATLKAMQEITGPVIGVALVLAAVFVPTAFIPGITGRLYQQFAVTIAVSVMISAFNALTLVPRFVRFCCVRRTENKGLPGKFFGWFNHLFGRATESYVRISENIYSEKRNHSNPAACLCSGRAPFREENSDQFSARRRPGVLLRQFATAQCSLSPAYRRDLPENRSDPLPDSRSAVHHDCCRLQLVERRAKQLWGLHFRHLESLGGSQKTGRTISSVEGQIKPRSDPAP